MASSIGDRLGTMRFDNSASAPAARLMRWVGIGAVLLLLLFLLPNLATYVTP